MILHFLSQKAESHWVAASSCIGLGAQVAHVEHTTFGVWTHSSPSRLPPAVCVAVAGARLLARQPPCSRANGRHSAGIQDIKPCCAFCLCSWGSPGFRQRTVSTKSLFWPVGDVRAPFRFPLRGRLSLWKCFLDGSSNYVSPKALPRCLLPQSTSTLVARVLTTLLETVGNTCDADAGAGVHTLRGLFPRLPWVFDLWVLYLQSPKDLTFFALIILGPIVSGLPEPAHRAIFLKKHAYFSWKEL